MNCPNGCVRTIAGKDGKETKVPVEMEYIETKLAPYSWWHCIICGKRVFKWK